MRVISFAKYLLFCIFFNVLCRPKFIMSTMESNCPESSVINDDVESAIDRLQTVLRKNYLAAERVMASRSHNADVLKVIGDTINAKFNKSLGAMSSAKVGPKAIVDLSQNKHERDVRCNKWLAEVNDSSDTEPVSDEIQELPTSKPPELSTQNEESCTLLSASKGKLRSTGSSTATIKRLAQWFSTFRSRRTPFGATKTVADPATDFLA